MPAIVPTTFAMLLGADAALLPRTPAITDAYHELLVVNQQRLSQWEPWAADSLTLDGTHAYLDGGARGWIDGTQLPTAIAVAVDDGWRLVGSAGLRVNRYSESAEAGYWIDGDHEGRGLVTRAMTALLEQAFGPLRLHRVTLHIDSSNERSKAVAARLGFTAEGVQRQAISVRGERRDDVIYGLLADEWRDRPVGPQP